MKYPYLIMLGLSLCAAFVFTPARQAILQEKNADKTFTASAPLGPHKASGEKPSDTPDTTETMNTSEDAIGDASEGASEDASGNVSGNTSENISEETPAESHPAEAEEPSEVSREHYFDNALFIGDSRTVGLFEYADMGTADVFADSGMSLYKVMDVKLPVGGEGEKTLEEILADKQYSRIYLMLGINELGYDQNETVGKYQELVEYLMQAQPQAQIILETNMHVSKKRSAGDPIYNNANIDAFNDCIRDIASKEGLDCIDINERFDDGEGNLAEEYTADDAHLMGKYYTEWADWIYESKG